MLVEAVERGRGDVCLKLVFPHSRTDTMDKWDQAKLDSVILSKHGNPRSTTDKVCKFFLQAVEDGKYGWFWEVSVCSAMVTRVM